MTHSLTAERLRRQIERLELELERVESMPEDEYLVGDVLMFERRFTPNGQPYTYVAVKAPNGWYFSGRNNQEPKTWQQVCDIITSESVDHVWVCTEWTEVEL